MAPDMSLGSCRMHCVVPPGRQGLKNCMQWKRGICKKERRRVRGGGETGLSCVSEPPQIAGPAVLDLTAVERWS